MSITINKALGDIGSDYEVRNQIETYNLKKIYGTFDLDNNYPNGGYPFDFSNMVENVSSVHFPVENGLLYKYDAGNKKLKVYFPSAAAADHYHSVTTSNHDHGVDTSDHTHDVTTADHSHAVTTADHSHDVTTSDHTHDVTTADHSHDVTTSDHSHDVTTSDHSHAVTTSDHSHGVTTSDHTHSVTKSITPFVFMIKDNDDAGSDGVNVYARMVDSSLAVLEYVSPTNASGVYCGLGTERVAMFDNDAAASGFKVYFYDGGALPANACLQINNTLTETALYVKTVGGALIKLSHNATAGQDDVEAFFDEDYATMKYRLQAVTPGNVDGTFMSSTTLFGYETALSATSSSAGGEIGITSTSAGGEIGITSTSAGGEIGITSTSAGGEIGITSTSAGGQSGLTSTSAGGEQGIASSSAGGQSGITSTSAGGQSGLTSSSAGGENIKTGSGGGEQVDTSTGGGASSAAAVECTPGDDLANVTGVPFFIWASD